MKRGSKFLIVALSTFAMAGTAAAQAEGEEGATEGAEGAGDATATDGTATDGTATDGTAEPGTEDTGGENTSEGGGEMSGDGSHSLTLTPGKILVNLVLQMNLGEDAIGKPFSITPDIVYGVMPKLDLGVYHSAMGLTGFWGGLGGGICVSGEENGCAKVYNGPIGLLAHYELLNNGQLALAADAGLVAVAFDPDFALGAKLGVIGRYSAGKINVGFAPNISIGFTQRDAGNKEVLNVPVDLSFMVTPMVGVGLQTGITGPLDGFGDAWRLPVSVGAMFQATPNISAGASFNLFAVATGFEGVDAFDGRGITVFAAYHN